MAKGEDGVNDAPALAGTDVGIARGTATLAIVVMLFAPKGIWGYAKDRFGITLFPTSYHVKLGDD